MGVHDAGWTLRIMSTSAVKSKRVKEVIAGLNVLNAHFMCVKG